jgi:hypothetical protein
LLNDDTSCAVDVWQTQFESNRYNDEVRQTYFLTLLVHGLRSLDKGKLDEAKEAYTAASRLLPSSDVAALSYLADATASFDSLVLSNTMDLHWNADPTVEDTWEGEYASHTNIVGAETTVFALTAKEPGWFNYFRTPTRSIPRLAYRFLFLPLTNTGFVTLYLGTLTDDNPVVFDLSFYTNWRAYWSIYESSESGINVVHQGAEVAVDLEQWHMVEARLNSTGVELWLDYEYLATVSLRGLEFETVGFGAGLHADSYSRTFTVLFDDEAIYALT